MTDQVTEARAARPLERIETTQSATYRLVDGWEGLSEELSGLSTRVQGARRQMYLTHLAQLQNDTNGYPATAVLDTLADYGFSWRHIARLAGVSVPAVQKWRRGERLSPDSRSRLGLTLAIATFIHRRYGIEPAEWMELAIPPADLTPIDLFVQGRLDLVLDLASRAEPAESILSEFDPNWRQTHMTAPYRTFVDEDGAVGISIEG